DAAWIERVRAELPELPQAMKERLVALYGLSAYEAATLTAERALARCFEDAVQAGGPPRLVATWLLGEVAAALNRHDLDIAHAPVTPAALAELLARIADGTISGK